MVRFVSCIVTLWLLVGYSSARAQSLNDQERCSIQAKKAYEESIGLPDSPIGKKIHAETFVLTNYQNHYNMKIGKCLVLVTRIFKDFSQNVILDDAFEHRNYALYAQQRSEVAPSPCWLVPNKHDAKRCTSKAEFDAFVSSYMEN